MGKLNLYGRTANRIMKINWQRNLFKLMLFIQIFYFILILFPGFSRATEFAYAEFGIKRNFLAGLFVFGIAQFLWGLKPRLLLLSALLGQLVYSLIVLKLFLQDNVAFSSFVAHFGILMLSVVMILRYSIPDGKQRTYFLIPIVTMLIMFGYTIGFLQFEELGFDTFRALVTTVLGFSFIFSGGYILHNHAQPATFYISLLPHVFYTFYGFVHYLNEPAGVPLIRPLVHILLLIFLTILTAIRAQES